MKKILTLQTVIVFFITILVSGACISACKNYPPRDPKNVTIYLKVIEIGGEMHLEMYDSNDTTIVVVDTLHTIVQPRTKVTWEMVKDSGIEKIKKISPKNGPGAIITGDAVYDPDIKKFKLKIPKNAPVGEEEYDIVLEDKNGNTKPIDPYLKIPSTK